jgi:hypothetical protein
MRTYVIYDRETGDLMHVALSPGPLDLDDDLVEELVATGRLERAAFAEVHPSRLPLTAVIGNPASLRHPEPPADLGEPAPMRFAV